MVLKWKAMTNLISVKNLTYSIPMGKDILKQLNFDLHRGEMLGVLGRNGVGKTTLIDLLLGIKPPSSGEVRVLEENPMDEERRELHSICYISQDVSLEATISVRQFLDLYAGFYPQYSKSDEARLLKYFSVGGNQQISSLSTGQQKKVQIIATISANPKILFIDEITAVLDPETRSHFFSLLLEEKQKKGLAIILATNIAEDLFNRADKILFIENGEGRIEQPENIPHLFNLQKSA